MYKNTLNSQHRFKSFHNLFILTFIQTIIHRRFNILEVNLYFSTSHDQILNIFDHWKIEEDSGRIFASKNTIILDETLEFLMITKMKL